MAEHFSFLDWMFLSLSLFDGMLTAHLKREERTMKGLIYHSTECLIVNFSISYICANSESLHVFACSIRKRAVQANAK